MFDYVFRAKSAGWAVLVADVHGEPSSTHMQKLWEQVIAPMPSTQLMVVAHSAGECLPWCTFECTCYLRVAHGMNLSHWFSLIESV
jgi:hypothetical protein